MVKFVFILLITITFIPVFADSHPVSKDYFYEWKEWVYNMFDWYKNQISTLESENEKLKIYLAYYQNKSNHNNHDYDYNPKYTTPYPTLTINEIFDDQSKSIIESCFNEQGYYVNPSITVFVSVKDNMLKIKGSGIHYDNNFSDQAVISLSPVNDYDGIKNIHMIEVRNDGRFVEFFDVSKIFYNDYVYAGTHYNDNIDSLGNYKIEIQYNDQCGFTNLEYHHRQSQSPTLEIQNEELDPNGYQAEIQDSSSRNVPTSQSQLLEPTKNPTRLEYYDNGNTKYYYKNNILVSEYYENGNFKVIYDDNGNLIAKYDINGNVVKSTPEPIDYSKLCIDEYDNFQEPTINLSASQTWVKENTIGSPISGSGIIKSGFSNSAILTILGPDKVSMSHKVTVKSDGTFWKFFEIQDMFVDDSLYGNYLIRVTYDDQCGEIIFDYVRGYHSTTPTLEEVSESLEVSGSVEVKPYNIPLPSNNGNFVNAHRSHVEIITLDVNVDCMDGKSSCFTPDKLTIPVGGEVIFVVNDGNGHTIAQGTDRAKMYDGEFVVDNLGRGGQFSHVFYNPGEYPYFSNIHPNAEGVVIVE